jgi:hypothetical protein
MAVSAETVGSNALSKNPGCPNGTFSNSGIPMRWSSAAIGEALRTSGVAVC